MEDRFGGVEKKTCHLGLEWGYAGALKSFKLHVFLIGVGIEGHVETLSPLLVSKAKMTNNMRHVCK